MSGFPSRATKPFAFDGAYTKRAGTDSECTEKGLVSFFDEEPVNTKNGQKSDWSAGAAPAEDLSEGMDDCRGGSSEELPDDLKNLISSMPHNRQDR